MLRPCRFSSIRRVPAAFIVIISLLLLAPYRGVYRRFYRGIKGVTKGDAGILDDSSYRILGLVEDPHRRFLNTSL